MDIQKYNKKYNKYCKLKKIKKEKQDQILCPRPQRGPDWEHTPDPDLPAQLQDSPLLGVLRMDRKECSPPQRMLGQHPGWDPGSAGIICHPGTGFSRGKELGVSGCP